MSYILSERKKELLLQRIQKLESKIAYLDLCLRIPPSQSIVFNERTRLRGKAVGFTDGLTERERRFVEEYPKDLNGAAAVRRAGYSAKGASVKANSLLSKPKILVELRKEQKRIAERQSVKTNHILKELATIAYSNIGRFIELRNGSLQLVDSAYLTLEDLSCVREISEQPGKYGTIVKFKLHDKLRALNMLAEYAGILGRAAKGPEKEEPEEVGKRVRDAVETLFESVPELPERELPGNVVRLGERLDEMERRAAEK
jgi:phage terminase small subunit